MAGLFPDRPWTSKRIKNMGLNRYLSTNVHCSIIFNSQKVETTQVSTNRRTDKQNVVYTYHRTLFSSKMEWGTNTCHKMDGPWKHGAKRKRSDTKGQRLHESTYMKYLDSAHA